MHVSLFSIHFPSALLAAHLLSPGTRLATTKTATDSDPGSTPPSQSDTVRRSFAAVDLPAKLSAPHDSSHAPSTSSNPRRLVDEALQTDELKSGDTRNNFANSIDRDTHDDSDFDHTSERPQSPPPQYPTSEASASTLTSLVSYRTAPPPFSSLYVAPSSLEQSDSTAQDFLGSSLADTEDFDQETAPREESSAPAYEPPVASGSAHRSTAFHDTVEETKRALPEDTKGEPSSRQKDEDAEPPPAYEEGYSPLHSFTYIMAAAGGASSIITQVQQGGPPINTLGGENPVLGSMASHC